MMKCLVKPLGVYLKNNPGNLADRDERAFDPITPYAQLKEHFTKMKKVMRANTFQRTWATGQRLYQKSRSPIWRIPDMANNQKARFKVKTSGITRQISPVAYRNLNQNSSIEIIDKEFVKR